MYQMRCWWEPMQLRTETHLHENIKWTRKHGGLYTRQVLTMPQATIVVLYLYVAITCKIGVCANVKKCTNRWTTPESMTSWMGGFRSIESNLRKWVTHSIWRAVSSDMTPWTSWGRAFNYKEERHKRQHKWTQQIQDTCIRLTGRKLAIRDICENNTSPTHEATSQCYLQCPLLWSPLVSSTLTFSKISWFRCCRSCERPDGETGTCSFGLVARR